MLLSCMELNFIWTGLNFMCKIVKMSEKRQIAYRFSRWCAPLSLEPAVLICKRLFSDYWKPSISREGTRRLSDLCGPWLALPAFTEATASQRERERTLASVGRADSSLSMTREFWICVITAIQMGKIDGSHWSRDMEHNRGKGVNSLSNQ